MATIKDFNWRVAQLAHIGWGGWIVFMAHLTMPLWAAVLVACLLAASKESLEGLGKAPWEGKQPWQGCLVDFLFFILGIAISTAILY